MRAILSVSCGLMLLVGASACARLVPGSGVVDAGTALDASPAAEPVHSSAGAAGAEASDIPRLRYEELRLPNGLTVILHEDHSVPLVTVNMWYLVGSGDEQPGRTGFAHLFEHVMFMGSQHVPVGMFDQWLESAGSTTPNGSTNTDRTNYYQTLPSHAMPLALWLEADRMGWMLPTMDQEKLDLQRNVVQNERRQSYDNVPYGTAGETILAALYPKHHPYSWPTIGSMQDLGAATLEDVTAFFRTYYAPNNATLSIAGHFDPDSAKTWVRRYFGEIPRGPDLPPRPTLPPVVVARDTFLVLEDRVQLPRLYYAWHSPAAFHADDAALDLLAYVLAGDKNSRLYRRLVYDMQAVQGVSASQQSRRLDGSFQVLVAPRPNQSPAALAAVVDEEITRVMRDGIDARELERARNRFRASFLDRLASVSSKADQLNFYNYYVGQPDYAREDAARYDAVTEMDIQRVARTYLGKPKVVLTVVPQGRQELMVRGTPR